MTTENPNHPSDRTGDGPLPLLSYDILLQDMGLDQILTTTVAEALVQEARDTPWSEVWNIHLSFRFFMMPATITSSSRRTCNKFWRLVAALLAASLTVEAFTVPLCFARRHSTTALQMNLFDRFSRLTKASLNEVLNKMEDPEKIMNQALEDMQGDLVKIRQSYAEVTATQRRLLKQKEQADALAQDWYKRAQLALEKGNDPLAKEALTRRQSSVDEGTNLQSQIDLQNESIDKLYEGMQLLEKKILEAKSKKDQMVARARTAQSTQKVNDMLGGVTGKTSMDAFTRMEEKVEALEAAADVSAEMGQLGQLPGSSDIEKEFQLLEASSSVDDELAAMKKNLLSGSSSSDDSKSSSSDSQSVDDELERLKKDAGL